MRRAPLPPDCRRPDGCQGSTLLIRHSAECAAAAVLSVCRPSLINHTAWRPRTGRGRAKCAPSPCGSTRTGALRKSTHCNFASLSAAKPVPTERTLFRTANLGQKPALFEGPHGVASRGNVDSRPNRKFQDAVLRTLGVGNRVQVHAGRATSLASPLLPIRNYWAAFELEERLGFFRKNRMRNSLNCPLLA